MDKDIQGKYGAKTIEEIPQNGFGIMDRGFASIERIGKLQTSKNRYFVLRVKNNITLEMLDDENYLIGVKKHKIRGRLVNFCDLENQSEYRLVTNLSILEEKSNCSLSIGN